MTDTTVRRTQTSADAKFCMNMPWGYNQLAAVQSTSRGCVYVLHTVTVPFACNQPTNKCPSLIR